MKEAENITYEEYVKLFGNFIKWKIPVKYPNLDFVINEECPIDIYFRWFNTHKSQEPIVSDHPFEMIDYENFEMIDYENENYN